MKNLICFMISVMAILGGWTSLQAAEQKLPQKMLVPKVQPASQQSQPKQPTDEVIQEQSEASSQAGPGIVLIQMYQKGVGRYIQLTSTCPPGMIAISGGGENTGMPVFYMKESFPFGWYGWRVVFDRVHVHVGPGQVGPIDLQPPAPYQITAYTVCIDRNIGKKSP